MKILAFIPARLESKRYPNKILKNIFNYPMIEHVRRRADLSGVFERTFIVTNSNYLKKKLKKYSSDIIITKKKHFSGTSRVSEISRKFKFDYAFIIFGDEPFLDYKALIHCKKSIKKYKNTDIFNLTTNLNIGDLKSTSVVKVLRNNKNLVTSYFRSKKIISPKKKILKSCGVLIFRKKILDNFKKFKVPKVQKKTGIEQFRFLSNNLRVRAIFYKNIKASINTPKEKEQILRMAHRDKEQLKIINQIFKK